MDVTATFGRLKAVHELDASLLARTETWIADAPDAELFRVNLATWAPAWSRSLPEAIAHFLHLARVGIFEMSWDAHCPMCNFVVARAPWLSEVRSHHWCKYCLRDVEVSLDDHYEVTFTVAPAVRAVAGRVRYELPRNVVVFADVDVAAGASMAVEVDIPERVHRVRVVVGPPTAVHVVPTAPVAAAPRLAFRGGEAITLPPTLATGRSALAVVNDTAEPRGLTLEAHDMSEYRPDELPTPRLRGIDVVSSPAFRQLFHVDTLPYHESLRVRDLTIVFTDVERSTQLYQRVGDFAAFELVRRHFDIIFDAVRAHHGTIVKTIGDAVMASFLRPADAVHAFVAVQRALREVPGPIRIRAAVHRGPVIAVTLNDRLDFFGTTINEAARMECECAADEVLVSDAVVATLDPLRAFPDGEVTSETRVLPGLADAYRLHRLRLPAPPRRQDAPPR